MKNLYKSSWNILVLFFWLLIAQILWSVYSFIISGLYSYDIPEKIVVEFRGMSGTYLLNLNTKEFQSYTGQFQVVNMSNQIYSIKTGKIIRNQDSTIINSPRITYIDSPVYWTENGKYIVYNSESQLWIIFGYLKGWSYGLTITELNSGKTLHTNIIGDAGEVLTIEKIHGFINN